MDSAMFMGLNQTQLFDTHAAAATQQLAAKSMDVLDYRADTAPVSMDSFYPALVQCFGIIIIGYIAGRCNVVTNAESHGLSTFTGTFALPALIFTSLVELNWSTVNWTFLLAMLISKAIVFVVVMLISLLVVRPLDLGRAGLFGIFCTQSNDFAVGYPILHALYADTHPEYVSYLYLMAPISLAILNPVGLLFMEIATIMKNKREDTTTLCDTACSSNCAHEQTQTKRFLGKRSMQVLNVFRSLFLNPMLLMTLLGVGGSFVFPDGLPEIIGSLLNTFGQAFSATALFLLGVKIVGQGSSLKGNGLLLPIILVLAKILVVPLVARQTVNIMQAGENFNDTTELSTYAFLYGTFPAAPGAFVIATQYNYNPELIAQSMVLCTFSSAPLMFMSAKMISLTNLNPEHFLNELDVFAFDISIVAFIAGIWVLIVLIATKSYKRMPHRITLCLIISQLMSCAGVMVWKQISVEGQSADWVLYLQFFLYNVGTYSSWLWTAVLAIVMLFLHCRSLCFVLRLWNFALFLVWGSAILLTTLLAIFDNHLVAEKKHNPSAHNGTVRTAISVFLLVMCFIVTVGCLILLQRYIKYSEKEARRSSADQRFLQSSVSTANLLSPSTAGNQNNHARGIRRSVSSETINSAASTDNEEEMQPNYRTTQAEIVATSTASERRVSIKRRPRRNSATDTPASRQLVDIEDLIKYNESQEPTSNGNVNALDCYNSVVPCDKNMDPNLCPANALREQEYQSSGLEPLESNNESTEQHFLRHSLLLIMLLCAMFVNLSVSIWTLVMDGMSGIYQEISFLNAFLNFGQSLMVLALFISDTGALFTMLMKVWRYYWYGANILVLPPQCYLSAETEHICDQFRTYHLEMCKKTIAKDQRWRLKVYRQVFFGCELVDWLIEIGLAKDRTEAVKYARHLVDGRVLFHINNVYHFEDAKLLYKFCNRFQTKCN